MWRTSIPLTPISALLIAAVSPSATAQVVAASPLGSFPARFEYVSNNAPFVVFDVAPRRLGAASAVKSFKALALSFVATDALYRVDVYTYVISKRGALSEAPTRIVCGSTVAGHHDCGIPTREALLLLKDDEGQFGLRIEAEGVEGERSTVRITLPVTASTARLAPAKVDSKLPLTLLSHTSGKPK